MSTDATTIYNDATHEDRTRHVARTGETEFAAIVRNRSGQDAGEIDYGLKRGPVIDSLSDADKQSLVDTAYALAEACERATGKRPTHREAMRLRWNHAEWKETDAGKAAIAATITAGNGES